MWNVELGIRNALLIICAAMMISGCGEKSRD